MRRDVVRKRKTRLEFFILCGYVAFLETEEAMRSIRSYIVALTAAAPSLRAEWRHLRLCAAKQGFLGTNQPETGLRKPD
jgi:hypothetical protein